MVKLILRKSFFFLFLLIVGFRKKPNYLDGKDKINILILYFFHLCISIILLLKLNIITMFVLNFN